MKTGIRVLCSVALASLTVSAAEPDAARRGVVVVADFVSADG